MVNRYILLLFFERMWRPPSSTLFPYTRSSDLAGSANRPRTRLRRNQHISGGPRIGACWSAGIEPAARNICRVAAAPSRGHRSEEHTSELQSRLHLVCRLLLEKKNILHDGEVIT